jgi:hypothetical protein
LAKNFQTVKLKFKILRMKWFWRLWIAKSEWKTKLKNPNFYICFSVCNQIYRRIKDLCIIFFNSQV